MQVKVLSVRANGQVRIEIDGQGLYRVHAGTTVLEELMTEQSAASFIEGYNGCRPSVPAIATSYADLADHN